MKEIPEPAADIQKLLYRKVPNLIEKLEYSSPDDCLTIVRVLKEITQLNQQH